MPNGHFSKVIGGLIVGNARSLFAGGQNTPTAEGNYAMRLVYSISNLSPGQSKMVKLVYSRM
jgi:hypothetical protein